MTFVEWWEENKEWAPREIHTACEQAWFEGASNERERLLRAWLKGEEKPQSFIPRQLPIAKSK